MQVNVKIGFAKQMVSDIPGNLLCWQAKVITRKDTVQVQLVDGRGAPACF